jgi:hypothetical protein
MELASIVTMVVVIAVAVMATLGFLIDKSAD